MSHENGPSPASCVRAAAAAAAGGLNQRSDPRNHHHRQNQRQQQQAEEDDPLLVLKRLYKALSAGDVEAVRSLLAPDIEWWFHGPEAAQKLMRMLTGAERLGSISFKPARVSRLQCGLIIAEGFLLLPSSSPASSTVVCWVHVFTIEMGKVVQLREYFNTSVTVTSGVPGALWQSQVTATSMPGLIVAV